MGLARHGRAWPGTVWLGWPGIIAQAWPGMAGHGQAYGPAWQGWLCKCFVFAMTLEKDAKKVKVLKTCPQQGHRRLPNESVSRQSCTRTVAPQRETLHHNLFNLLPDLGSGLDPKGLELAAAFTRADSQILATILDPFRIIFNAFGPDKLSRT